MWGKFKRRNCWMKIDILMKELIKYVGTWGKPGAKRLSEGE